MNNIGEIIKNIGYQIMPISFVAYLMLTIVQYKWKTLQYTKCVKVLWYLVIALGESSNEKRIALIAIMMVYMDAIDSFFEFLEERREKKKSSIS